MSNLPDISDVSASLGEPKWLFDLRTQTFLKGEELPRGEKYGIAIPALEMDTVPEFRATAEYEVTPSKGLELYTWKEAVTQEEIAAVLERLLTSELLAPAQSLIAAFGRALFRSGLVVYVQPTLDDAGNSALETLTLNTTVPQGESADIIVVIAKTGSRLALKSLLTGGGERSCFARTIIVLAEEDARVEFSSSAHDLVGFISQESYLLTGAHSSVEWTEDPICNGKYRSVVHASLLGEGAKSEILHTVLASEHSAFDIWAGVDHAASDTYSRIFALGLAAGESRVVYRGKINMKQGVARVNGEQEGKFLIVSDKASVDAIPALDIASKDVHSVHKLSVSHIRALDLFYAKSRGLGERDARSLTLEGFFGTILNKIGKEALLESVRSRIAKLNN